MFSHNAELHTRQMCDGFNLGSTLDSGYRILAWEEWSKELTGEMDENDGFHYSDWEKHRKPLPPLHTGAMAFVCGGRK